MTRVLADISADTALVKKSGGTSIDGSGHGEGGKSLALPKSVVEEGLRSVREGLEAVCVVER